MKRWAVILCCALICFIASGCSKPKQNAASNTDDEISRLNERCSLMESQIADIEKNMANLNNRLQEEISVISSLKNDETEALPVYGANINDYKKEIKFYISIPKNDVLFDKLNIIAQKLSSLYFSSLPIEVTNIVTEENKKVAVINLKESKENQGINDPSKYKGATWATQYFQGSAGGTLTSVCLIETFLQRDYKGEWIDGVRFTYNGGPIDQFDHVPNLSHTNFR